ncbi:MAG: TIGR02646 family protein [Saprospiraceae bacterium]|nr:TIGR02646 family protein [Saprospiraceae bacterium]
MRQFKRTQAPDFLAENAAAWGQEYAEKRRQNPSYRFNWKSHKGQRVNQLIEPLLKAMTDHHCAYCDHFPSQTSDDTIDHFGPKSDERFYLLAYEWTNLYSGCADCQKVKNEQYDEALLRPDSDDFSFERYFTYDYDHHKIEVRGDASPDDQYCAVTTIRIFGLNRKGLTDARRHAWERYIGKNQADINLLDFPYRFMFEL